MSTLEQIDEDLNACGIGHGDPAFNLTWHDWLNLKNLIVISKVIAGAAMKRENSRGAHYREDFPEPGDMKTSTFTVVRMKDGTLDVEDEPVAFTRIRPGETLLSDTPAAAE